MATGPDDDNDSGAPTGDDESDPQDEYHTALPPKVERWRQRSATGAILTGLARGFQQVFEKEREQQAIVMQTSGDPPTDLPVEAEVEQARPRQSVVNIRPWLLGKPAKETTTAVEEDASTSEESGDHGVN